MQRRSLPLPQDLPQCGSASPVQLTSHHDDSSPPMPYVSADPNSPLLVPRRWVRPNSRPNGLQLPASAPHAPTARANTPPPTPTTIFVRRSRVAPHSPIHAQRRLARRRRAAAAAAASLAGVVGPTTAPVSVRDDSSSRMSVVRWPSQTHPTSSSSHTASVLGEGRKASSPSEMCQGDDDDDDDDHDHDAVLVDEKQRCSHPSLFMSEKEGQRISDHSDAIQPSMHVSDGESLGFIQFGRLSDDALATTTPARGAQHRGRRSSLCRSGAPPMATSSNDRFSSWFSDAKSPLGEVLEFPELAGVGEPLHATTSMKSLLSDHISSMGGPAPQASPPHRPSHVVGGNVVVVSAAAQVSNNNNSNSQGDAPPHTTTPSQLSVLMQPNATTNRTPSLKHIRTPISTLSPTTPQWLQSPWKTPADVVANNKNTSSTSPTSTPSKLENTDAQNARGMLPTPLVTTSGGEMHFMTTESVATSTTNNNSATASPTGVRESAELLCGAWITQQPSLLTPLSACNRAPSYRGERLAMRRAVGRMKKAAAPLGAAQKAPRASAFQLAMFTSASSETSSSPEASTKVMDHLAVLPLTPHEVAAAAKRMEMSCKKENESLLPLQMEGKDGDAQQQQQQQQQATCTQQQQQQFFEWVKHRLMPPTAALASSDSLDSALVDVAPRRATMNNATTTAEVSWWCRNANESIPDFSSFAI